MTKHMLRDLERVRVRVEELGRVVQAAVAEGVDCVLRRDAERARKVIEGDRWIDREEVEVEEECLKVLALHQPVAADLRLLVGILKLNNDLERIGDMASTIAGNAGHVDLSREPALADRLRQLADRSQNLLREGLECLIQQDEEQARRVCAADDEVDRLHVEYRDAAQKVLAESTGGSLVYIEGLLRSLSVSRSLERIADHATNIAEDVIYMVSGTIPRHCGGDES